MIEFNYEVFEFFMKFRVLEILLILSNCLAWFVNTLWGIFSPPLRSASSDNKAKLVKSILKSQIWKDSLGKSFVNIWAIGFLVGRYHMWRVGCDFFP